MQYPNNIKKSNQTTITYANRGMALEKLINEANDYYNEHDIALITKKPTPIGISEAVYGEKGRIIKHGYFKSPSTLDYNGVYKGKYIEFEAKETKSKTSFPLSNFHEHQLVYLKRVLEHQGICFVIIRIKDHIFFLKGEDIVSFLNSEKRKSIPYKYIEEKGYLLKEQYNPSIDYLKIVDKVYLKENENGK